MARVTYLRPPFSGSRANRGYVGGEAFSSRRRRGPYVALGLVLLALVVIAAGLIVVSSSSASLTTDPTALAKVGMPLGGGRIASVIMIANRDQRPVPIEVRGQQIWPRVLLPAHTTYTIQVVVRRPGWISWLAGRTERLQLEVTTPTAHLTSHYLTVARGAPLELKFVAPVATVSYGLSSGSLKRHVFSAPQTTVKLPYTASAGTIFVAAAPRSWEISNSSMVSWFPAGAAASAVANPAPGTTIHANTPITLTFSKPVSQALGKSLPPVSPNTQGSWHTVNDHTIVFRPAGFGYGIGTNVSIGLPSGVKLVGGKGSVGSWTVPPGSTLRLQQLLAQLGYLPVQFTPNTPVAKTPSAQENAAVDPPKGTFSFRWSNTPSPLKKMWAPGVSGTMTQGAIMAFENNEGMTTDGLASAPVWQALMNAAISGKGASTFGYTFVQVSEGSPETEQTWHSGKTVVHGLVNTGIPAAPTALGVYPVFEHALSVTMSGTNPDGSHYSDPGVPYVSYFNGGDALHGFIRASYGFPQSLGCVEMPYSEAASVYPYTPIGTLVDVE